MAFLAFLLPAPAGWLQGMRQQQHTGAEGQAWAGLSRPCGQGGAQGAQAAKACWWRLDRGLSGVHKHKREARLVAACSSSRLRLGLKGKKGKGYALGRGLRKLTG